MNVTKFMHFCMFLNVIILAHINTCKPRTNFLLSEFQIFKSTFGLKT